jgi:hypothetical protein
MQSLWEKVGDGEYFVTQTSCTHPSCPVSPDIVRMDVTRTMKLKQISSSLTSIKFVGSLHLGGSFPASINKIVTIPLAMDIVPKLALFFTAIRPEHEYDNGDSTELGLLAFHELYRHREHEDTLRKEINKIISIVNVLRACQAKYRFLDEYLYHIMKNNMQRGAAQTGFNVGTPLVALTANEAGLIARSLPMLLLSNVNGEAAVDEYIRTYTALGELDHEFTWYRPAMVAIATELMGKVAYGVKIRAGVGGSVSILDLVSDVAIIAEYLTSDKTTGFAYMLIGMVTANLVFQLCMVWTQTQGLAKNKWRTMAFEMLATVFFVKPALDSWKVASGAEQQAGSALSPLNEMSMSKGIEMVFEAIPGFVLQSIAIISVQERSTTAVVSLLISAASTGLTATTIFYDIDVDPGMRKRNATWMGVIPNQGRGLAFATVFAFCTLHVLAKGAATALLYIANPAFLVKYIAVDYGLYFLLFAGRGDMIYFPAMPPTASWIFAPIIRVIIKVLGILAARPMRGSL